MHQTPKANQPSTVTGPPGVKMVAVSCYLRPGADPSCIALAAVDLPLQLSYKRLAA